MRLLASIIGGLIGGIIGALIWGGIAYGTGYEVGWIAWGIGVLVGIGAVAGAQDDAGWGSAIAASVIALASIAGGKYLAVHWAADAAIKKSGAAQIEITDDQIKIYLADQVVEEYTKQNKTLKWPAGKSADDAETEADYPADVMKDVNTRYATLTDDQKKEYRAYLKDRAKTAIASIQSAVEGEAFTHSFSFFDLLWAVLAVGSAFKIASGNLGDD